MNSELRDLLAGLHESPTDDALWLIVADWLEEHDELPRAELLRLVRGLRGMALNAARLAIEHRVQAMLLSGVVPLMPTLTNSIGMELALIPPGVTTIGSPEEEVGRYGDEPYREVALTQPYYLGVHAVTQAQWTLLMENNPSAFSASGRVSTRRKVDSMDTSRFPVERVTWHEAKEFCLRLSNRPEEKAAGRVYRLPTEIEWEFACRGEASRMTASPYGSKILPKDVNFRPDRRRSKANRGRPVEVGSLPPNAFGLHEMCGNIWEWCEDWYHSTIYNDLAAVDPPWPETSDRKNARGGTYALEERRSRSADRSSFEPDHRDIDCGLRVLLPWQGSSPEIEEKPKAKRKPRKPRTSKSTKGTIDR